MQNPIDWHAVACFGVAGNFAGHLEQAGEDADFVALDRERGAPKGLFPFYLPDVGEHFLGRFPISSEVLRLSAEHPRHQIEPEMSVLFDLDYEAGRVVDATPRLAFAHNDCSIRRPGATKISEKKNWGPDTKGRAAIGVPVDHLRPGGSLDAYRIASFLERDGRLHAYGADSAVVDYSYFHERLLAWLIDRLAEQPDEGPLEDIPGWLDRAGHPERALIAIGATRYTPFGETHFLEPGDRAIVALYDAERYDTEAVTSLARRRTSDARPGLSLLEQRVVMGAPAE